MNFLKKQTQKTDNQLPVASASSSPQLATGSQPTSGSAASSETEKPLVSLVQNKSVDQSQQQQQQQQQHQQSSSLAHRVNINERSQTSGSDCNCRLESQQHNSGQSGSPGKQTPLKVTDQNYIDQENIGLIDKSTDCCCSRRRATHLSSFNHNQQQQRQLHNHPNQQHRCIMSKTVSLIPAYFLAELVGTFLLVVIGDGAISAYVLTKQPVDLFTACFAFGVGAMIATFATSKISGAHLNPAATLAFALDGRLKWKLVPVYMLAQYLGGFLAALVLMVNSLEAIAALDGGERSAIGNSSSTGQIFATYPGSWVSPWGALLDQIIGTALLLFSLSAVTDKTNAGLDDRHQPLVVSLVIGLICVAFSPNCGAIFNPARDLAPRLVTSLFGYPLVWAPVGGLYWFLAGVLGPHIGAILGVFAYKFLIGYPLASKRELSGEFAPDMDPDSVHEKHQRITLKQRSDYGAAMRS